MHKWLPVREERAAVAVELRRITRVQHDDGRGEGACGSDDDRRKQGEWFESGDCDKIMV